MCFFIYSSILIEAHDEDTLYEYKQCIEMRFGSVINV